ncbi:DNA-formamidopyrimidine glycosylase [Candidatus Phytoplasma australasiaticum]|uniref:DNA-formamidopyrimidine glycosylase n=1 Tax=Candidatus Phytoplasma australasiaticum TaxID=2754999 RepID=UPI003B977B0D
MKNQFFLKVKRKGKYLIFFLSNDLVLIGHLRMEGKINLNPIYMCNTIDKHEYWRLWLDNDIVMRYYDTRKFGRFLVYNYNEYLIKSPLVKLAADPFEISLNDFYHKLQKTTRVIKQVLLDQSIISGIGNIYASEILFLACIHPNTPSFRLSLEKVRSILKHAQNILKASIEDGATTTNTFEALGIKGNFQKKLLVYRKDKDNCCRCNKLIQKIKINGRSSYFCSFCQLK